MGKLPLVQQNPPPVATKVTELWPIVRPESSKIAHARYKALQGLRMIIGNPDLFAIESVITEAYERLGLRGLGYFVIHVAGGNYGVKEPDATMLACSFDEVGRRLAERGSHVPIFPIDANAGEIAHAFIRTGYTICEEGEQFFGMSAPQFREATKRLEWAPDGDAAFDDGSYVLQVEDAKNVRLIAYVSTPEYAYAPATLREVWLSSEVFYETLRSWRDCFEAEWVSAPKVSDGYKSTPSGLLVRTRTPA